MIDKYNLTREQSVFLAKKMIIPSIYNSAKLEGCNVTFPDTQTIVEGRTVGNLDTHDVQIILNLKNSWKYLLNNLDKPFNLDFAIKLNSFVSYNESLDWGVLRYGKVGITGVKYTPEIPVEHEVKEKIKEIMSIKNVTERAIKYMLWGMRAQNFWDGNKRTSTLSANKILITEGKGVISIAEDHLGEFNRRLTDFYESNDYSKIDTFIYEKCLHGIEFE